MKYLTQVPIATTFGSPFGTGKTIGDLVSVILSISFVVAGIILLVAFIVGGIGIISGAGQSDPEKVEKGKKALTSTVIGFVVVFVAYWIVKLLEGVLKITLLP